MNRQLIVGLFVALLIGGSLSACQPVNAPPTLQPGEIEIPFETVVLDEEGLVSFVSEDPLLLAITSPAEIPMIADRLSYDSLAKLQEVDFERFSIIALFRDAQLSTGYPTYIKRIVKRNHRLVIYAEFWAPPQFSPQGMAITATYHLIKIANHERLLDDIEFVLQTEIITPTPSTK